MRRMETISQAESRHENQERALKSWLASSGDVICLQELNPVRARARELSEKLGMRGESALVNTGIKCGTVGIPPLLSEGLGIFAGRGFSELKFEEVLLSGSGLELHLSFCDLTLQVAERRKALMMSGVLEGQRVVVANLHLHHGPDSTEENSQRKISELGVLRDRLDPLVKNADLALVCGDFNTDGDSKVMEPIRKMGFKDVAELAGATVPPTWDARVNPLAALSPEAATSEEARQWDATPHVFDRIYVAGSVKQVRYSQIREPGLSDHFAVCAEITW